jgi:RNA polymerase sigma-70 factor (ECF subfamily)
MRDLLAGARAGSREALGQLLESCRDYLLLIAGQELDVDLRAKGGASDLVQETFLEAQRDFIQFRGDSEAELLGWLRRLLLNNLANFSRQYRTTGKRHVEREVPLQGQSSSFDLRDNLAASVPTPAEQAMEQEQADLVDRVLERLPEDYRQVLLWRYREELAFEEIARRLGRTENAVRKLWARALERFQAEMGTPP